MPSTHKHTLNVNIDQMQWFFLFCFLDCGEIYIHFWTLSFSCCKSPFHLTTHQSPSIILFSLFKCSLFWVNGIINTTWQMVSDKALHFFRRWYWGVARQWTCTEQSITKCANSWSQIGLLFKQCIKNVTNHKSKNYNHYYRFTLPFQCIFRVNVGPAQNILRHSCFFALKSIDSTCFGP